MVLIVINLDKWWFGFLLKKNKKFFICYDFYLYKIKKNNKIIKYVLRLLV